jgi:D-tyrosyl-tRNA(Tyr) deacylase
MRVLLQRILDGWVETAQGATPRAGPGTLALVGFHRADTAAVLEPMARKLIHLRIFDDEHGRMNRSLHDVRGHLVLVPQFTLYAECRRGRRPDFLAALAPGPAAELFGRFVALCRGMFSPVSTGTFGAAMRVHLVNDGPVTILLDSADWSTPPAPGITP